MNMNENIFIGGKVMKINLKEIYSHIKEDIILDIDDAIYELFADYERQEKNYRERVRKNRAYYSLDREDGIENGTIQQVDTVVKTIEERELEQLMLSALMSIPDKQASRIYKYFFLEMTMTEIALQEGVHKSRVSSSIAIGLKNLKKIIEKNYMQNF